MFYGSWNGFKQSAIISTILRLQQLVCVLFTVCNKQYLLYIRTGATCLQQKSWQKYDKSVPDTFRPLSWSLEGLNQLIYCVYLPRLVKKTAVSNSCWELVLFTHTCVTSQWVSCYLWWWLWHYHSEQQQQIVVERPGNWVSYCTMPYHRDQ